jgi:hypothetical protein
MTPAEPTADPRLDEEALRALSTAYAAAVDGCDGAMLASLFVAEGELVVPNYPDDLRPTITRTGHEALRRLPDGLRRYHRTFHQVSNHSYAIEGDRATGEVQCVAHHVTGTGGRAEDGRAGTDSVWFIATATSTGAPVPDGGSSAANCICNGSRNDPWRCWERLLPAAVPGSDGQVAGTGSGGGGPT